ncbi:MAG: DUF5606 domain-containing protein [Cyclobacteriaceae bacterium]|nr:DUF5606 domain-containing protein [Cyclobacteriaceae bacterium]MCH8515110.1 DUF5606 domain-containing protein [Cyclobacteriaceae bacterium]
MNFKDIVSIAGKGGLYKIVKPTRSGVIVESLDEEKKRFPTSANSRVSILEEISIYTTDAEGSIPLKEVMYRLHNEFSGDLGLEKDANKDEYMALIKHVLPNFDAERVYPSDVKKLTNWYKLLVDQAPEVLTKQDDSSEEENKEKN